jgi:hypothetical protein
MIKCIAVFKNPLQFLKILYEDIKHLHGGQHRLVSRIGVNGKLNRVGRIYGATTGDFASKSKTSIKCEMRVQRANGKIEHYISDNNGFRRVK